jgi:hypothetical protein
VDWRKAPHIAAFVLAGMAGLFLPWIWSAAVLDSGLGKNLALGSDRIGTIEVYAILLVPEILAYLLMRRLDRKLARVYGIAALVASAFVVAKFWFLA